MKPKKRTTDLTFASEPVPAAAALRGNTGMFCDEDGGGILEDDNDVLEFERRILSGFTGVTNREKGTKPEKIPLSENNNCIKH